MGSTLELIVAHCRRSAQGRVHFITTLYCVTLPWSLAATSASVSIWDAYRWEPHYTATCCKLPVSSTYLLLWENRFGVPSNNLLSAKAVDGVIVDHAGGLHMGVADGRADELEAALVQILTQRIGFRAGGRIILQSAESVDHGCMINEVLDIGRKAAEGCLYVKKPLGIGDGRMDF